VILLLRRTSLALLVSVLGCSAPPPTTPIPTEQPGWLAGDHHIHSQYSAIWDGDVDPPIPELRSHGVYPIPQNAVMAKFYGLAWIVITDHGGLEHSKLNFEQAYPELLLSREVVPEVLQFYGVELNSPGADHVSIVIPHSHEEADQVYELESRFEVPVLIRRTASSVVAEDTEECTTEACIAEELAEAERAAAERTAEDLAAEPRMLEALEVMQGFAEKPVVIANHPSRTAAEGEPYGRTSPSELRSWNDKAPDIAVGMAGAPGHQAGGLIPEGSSKTAVSRGDYPSQSTHGGFDPMTATLGGLWDSMLGEGRRWWITANSDSHRHWTEGGVDFWPGEYSKTYVLADDTYADILQALRTGKVFVTTGDLISEMVVSAQSESGEAQVGDGLLLKADTELVINIRVRDPEGPNANGDLPAVSRIDLISGEVNPELMEAAQDSNPTTQVIRRFSESDWTRDGEFLSMTHRLQTNERSQYIRVRGTNTGEREPTPDPIGEDPWTDLWFYSNPIFLMIE